MKYDGVWMFHGLDYSLTDDSGRVQALILHIPNRILEQDEQLRINEIRRSHKEWEKKRELGLK